MPRPPSKPPQNNFFFKPPANFGLVNEANKLFQQGFALLNQGRLEQAKETLEKVVKLNAKHVDAIHLLGIIAAQLKEFEHADSLFHTAIKLNPNNAAFYCNRGNVLKELKQLEKAVSYFDKAIFLNKDYALAYLNRSLALFELKQFEEAFKSSEKAIYFKLDYAEAYHQHGLNLKELKRFDEALACYDKAIELKHDFAEAYSNRGIVLNEFKRFDEASASYDKAIELKPDYAEAYLNRGTVEKELKLNAEALASYEKAIELKHDFAEAYYNRGILLKELRRLDEALESYDKAIELQRDYAEAYSNRGIVLKELMRMDEALESYDKAIELKPKFALAHCNKSFLLLTLQDFESGWKLYEWRWENEAFTSPKRNFPQPLWLGGESLANKTILLHAEQGLGDSIQFCRYVALVKELGARVLLEVPKPLMTLLNDLVGIDELFEAGKQLTYFDYQCPLLSLPLAFKTDLNSIPSPRPYLKSKSEKLEVWNQRLGEKSKPRIGITWSGSTIHQNDQDRSLALADLIQYLPRDFEYVSLQKDVRDSDKDVLTNSAVKNYGEHLSDFTDTAALCDLMDLVISVDTSVAHLAGALGKPTWILLPFIPDWRWLLYRCDSPWYESVKLYRKGEDRQWEPVLARVARDLTELNK